MFDNSYDKIRSLTYIFFIIAVIAIIVSCFVLLAESPLVSLLVGLALFISVYEVSLYLMSYADLVENSFISRNYQEQIAKSLEILTHNMNDKKNSNSTSSSTSSTSYTPETHTRRSSYVTDSASWVCPHCNTRNSISRHSCSACYNERE